MRAANSSCDNGSMETLTLHSPEETLVLIPHLLGFHPEHHLVLLSLEHGGTDASQQRSRIGPIVTIDLDDHPLSPEVGASVARAITQFRIRAAVIVLYAESPTREMIEYFDLIGDLAAEGTRAYGGELFAAYVAEDDGWRAMPLLLNKKRPWSDLESRPLAADLIYSGSAPYHGPFVPPYEPEPLDVREYAAQIGSEWLASCWSERTRAGAELWTSILLSEDEPELDVLARANASLRCIPVRDRIILYVQSADDVMPLDGLDDESVRALTAAPHSATPDIPRAERTLAMLDRCAALALDDECDALATAAFVAWWMGRSSWAAERNELALAAEPEYALAGLLAQILDHSIMPPWVD